MEYVDMDKENLIIFIKDKDKEISDLESEINDKNDDIEKLENEISDLEDSLQDFEDLGIYGEIIKQIDSMGTDDVAKIYYAIENSHHFRHLEKFKML